MEMRKFRSEVVMPETYFITYSQEKEKGIMTQVSMGKDEQGNVFFRSGDKKRIFIKEQGGYRSYFVEKNGIFALEKDAIYSEGHVKEATKEFFDCVNKSIMQRIGHVEYQKSALIAGRECEIYDVKVKVAVFSQSFLCAVDNETGICLRWKQETDLNGFVLSPGGNFECIEFSTCGVREKMPYFER